MPGVYRQGDINSTLAQAFQRIRALETQQQMILSNLQGLSVMALGLIPGSQSQRFGLEAVNPNTGNPLAFLGYDSSLDTAVMQFSNSAGQVTGQLDSDGLHFYDASGVEMSRVDVNGTHYYNPADGHELVRLDGTGLHVLDDTGTGQADLGLLNASPAIYGLQVRNAAGTMQQVAGVVSAGPGSLGDVTSTSPILITGTAATAEIGPSGQALVTVCGSAEMNPANSSGGYAYMGVGVDGVAPGAGDQWVNDQTDQYAQLTLSLSATQLVTGLSPGSHTFEAYGWVSSTVTGNFGYVYVTVIPQ